jgi:hypothetical protein
MERPLPPTRQQLLAVLRRVIDAEPLLADRPADEIEHGLQRLDMASSWQLWIWWVDGVMGPLSAAQAPDGGRWTHGADRWPDWLAGPDAVPLDPITHLLTAGERERLEARLLSCCCWPPPDPMPLPEPPSMAELLDSWGRPS